MIHYPAINLVAFHIGPLSVFWYGLMYLFSFVIGWGLLALRIKRSSFARGVTIAGQSSDNKNAVTARAALPIRNQQHRQKHGARTRPEHAPPRRDRDKTRPKRSLLRTGFVWIMPSWLRKNCLQRQPARLALPYASPSGESVGIILSH